MANLEDHTSDSAQLPPSPDSASDVATAGSQEIDMPRRPDSRNARSKSMTMVDGPDTHGVLNQYSSSNPTFDLGIADNVGPRRFMEDAHSFIIDFAGVRGQGFFAVFDGHAGKDAAEWCGHNFHECLLEALRTHPDAPIPDVLNTTFHDVDAQLSEMCAASDGKMHSGCTAVTAFLRIEDDDGKQSFCGENDPLGRSSSPGQVDGEGTTPGGTGGAANGTAVPESPTEDKKKNGSGSRIKQVLKSISGANSSLGTKGSRSPSPTITRYSGLSHCLDPPPSARRVLYCANAGDARGVLCRSGKAVRLTYDHKGSDKQEAKRITDAGGFMMSGRVNGVLAVTRSLGDSSMKDFVVGSPYTTETELCDDDEFLILACDGLWDVIDDQSAVDLVRNIRDADAASKKLLDHALGKTSDNVTILVVRFKTPEDK